jgi:hypothetical protein
MTCTARNVLKDCRRALIMMEGEKDFETWRILWAGAIALIRAVGHVLDKVDGVDPILKSIAKESFLKWKTDEKHLIFPQFIEMERNNLLKEYSTNVHPLEEVRMALDVVLAPLEGNEKPKTVTLQDIFNLGENIYRPMLEGPWIGDDCRDVYKEAIEWWEQELDLIDREVEYRKSVR